MRLRSLALHNTLRAVRFLLPLVLLGLVATAVWSYRSRRPSTEARPGPVTALVRNLAMLTEGFSFSRTEGDRVVFSVKAKTNLGFKDNRNLLESVEVVIRGEKEGEPDRRVSSDRCEYDQRTDDIRFSGNVRITLTGTAEARTEELVYSHRERRATSVQRIFLTDSKGVSGEADHLEYAMQEGVVRMRGAVRVRTAEGVDLQSASAVYVRAANRVTAEQAVVTNSNGSIRAGQAEVQLTPETFQPRTIRFLTDVSGSFRDARNLMTAWNASGDSLDLSVAAAGVVENAVIRGRATLEKRSEGSPPQTVKAQELHASFGSSGAIDTLDARGSAEMTMGQDQTLNAETIRTNASGDVVTEGASRLNAGESVVEGRRFTIRQGEIIRFSTPERATLRSGGRTSAAETTTAEIDSRTNRLIRLLQIGGFTFVEGERRGSAERAEVGADNTVRLDGQATFTQAATRVEADSLTVRQDTDEFQATGRVRTVSVDRDEVLLVRADRLDGAGPRATYAGRVNLWRGNVFIQASRVDADQEGNRFDAKGRVRSRMDMVEVESDALHFEGASETARFEGNVHARRDDTDLRARQMHVRIEERRVREILAEGAVVAKQGARTGSGDRAVYDVAGDRVTLTGRAEVTDAQTGRVQGPELVLRPRAERAEARGTAAERIVSTYRVRK